MQLLPLWLRHFTAVTRQPHTFCHWKQVVQTQILAHFFKALLVLKSSEILNQITRQMILFLPKSFHISILSKSSFISTYFYSLSAISSHANSLSCNMLLILKTEISVGNSGGMRSHYLQKGRAESRKTPTNRHYFFYHILIYICC